MNFLAFAAIILGAFFLPVLALRVTVYFKERKNKEIFFSSFLTLIISFLIILSFLYLARKSRVCPCILFISTLFYAASTFLVKSLTTYLIAKKQITVLKKDINSEERGSEIKVFWLFQLDCVLFSLDYCFTYVCKNFLFGFKKEDNLRSKIIKCFNVENIFFSGLFGMVLMLLFHFAPNSLFLEWFLFLT